MRFKEVHERSSNRASLVAAISFAIGHGLPAIYHKISENSELGLYAIQLICFIIVGYLCLVQVLTTLNKETRTKKSTYLSVFLGIGVIVTLFLPEGIGSYLKKKEEPLFNAYKKEVADCYAIFTVDRTVHKLPDFKDSPLRGITFTPLPTFDSLNSPH